VAEFHVWIAGDECDNRAGGSVSVEPAMPLWSPRGAPPQAVRGLLIA